MPEDWRWMSTIVLFSILRSGSSDCEENIVTHINKDLSDNSDTKILSNLTAHSEKECSNECCTLSDCDMAVYNVSVSNCILHNCHLSCEITSKEGSVLFVKKLKGENDLHPKVQIQNTAPENSFIKNTVLVSTGTAITLLVVGCVAFIGVLALVTLKCVEWNPSRKYNRIHFLMNDVNN